VTANAAYRIVQESLTNALKHAPGAPVQITLHGQGSHLEIEVINGAARQRPSGLERSGSGRGLTGMRERAAACGGTVTAARTAADGWMVAARLPLSGQPPAETVRRAWSAGAGHQDEAQADQVRQP
jgi:signal transduction histidine kinase